MASYATVAEFREILPQVTVAAASDALVQKFLDRATAIVDRALGFSFAAYGSTTTAKDVRAKASGEYLYLPAYEAASVASVYAVSAKGTTSETTAEVTGWQAHETGRPYCLYRGAGWTAGQWYRVTADWGYGPAPVDIVEVTLEVAVNLWGSRDSRQISDVVGVEGGGAVGYNRALTNRQRMTIDNVKLQYGEFGLG